MKNILLLDPKGVISKGGVQTLDRHLLYAKELGNATQNEFRLIIVTKSDNQKKEELLGNLLLINFQSHKSLSICLAIAARNRLRNENIGLIVVGDPWFSFYSGLLLRVFLWRRIPIQVQIHADLFSQDWLNGSTINRIKSILSWPAIRIADSVRFVSQKQLNNGLNKLHGLKEKSFVAPVYLEEPICNQTPHQKTFQDGIKVGVLGRIHQDRGLDKLIPLFMPIIGTGVKICVIIAGEGQYKKILQDHFVDAGMSEHFVFIGHVSGEQLNNFWEEIDVLVSLAPTESYGRSIREALLAGVPIWAAPSSGVMDLKELTLEGEISLLEFDSSPEEQIDLLRKIVNQNISRETKRKIILENQRSVRKLINSWVDFSVRGDL